MNTYYKAANLICAIILLVLAITGIASNAVRVSEYEPSERLAYSIAGVIIMCGCVTLVRIAHKELKQY